MECGIYRQWHPLLYDADDGAPPTRCRELRGALVRERHRALSSHRARCVYCPVHYQCHGIDGILSGAGEARGKHGCPISRASVIGSPFLLLLLLLLALLILFDAGIRPCRSSTSCKASTPPPANAAWSCQHAQSEMRTRTSAVKSGLYEHLRHEHDLPWTDGLVKRRNRPHLFISSHTRHAQLRITLTLALHTLTHPLGINQLGTWVTLSPLGRFWQSSLQAGGNQWHMTAA